MSRRLLTLLAGLGLGACAGPGGKDAPTDAADDTGANGGDSGTNGGTNGGDNGATDLLASTIAQQDAALVPLAAPRLARRLSLDLRGVLPTAAELDAVEADPASLDGLRDAWLADPRFESRLVVLFGERWLTRVDSFLILYQEYPELGNDPTNEYPFERAVGEEPLRLMARVAASDRPWTDVVTADWTMANEVTGLVWPLDYPRGQSGWRESRYTDGRPAAGVLATNGLWWRYYTTFTNYNRGRAAAIARLLLCEDVLGRPVSFGGEAVSSSEGLEAALRSNPYCLGCHSSIDPLAATLFGFWPANTYNGVESHTYHPEREPLGGYLMDTTPAWFGHPVGGLAEVGAAVAQDPRFPRCTAETMASLLWRRPTTVEDYDRVDAFREALLAGDTRLKPLVVAITDDPVYRAGGLLAGATDTQLATETTVRLVDVALLASSLEDLTGFTWSVGGFDLLDSDTTGYRVLGGSVDGDQVTRAQATAGVTWALVTERVAEAAADEVVRGGYGSGLLAGLSAADEPGDDAFDATLDALHWRLYGVRADAAWRADIAAVWSAVDGREGPDAAWRAVLAAMIRDPLFVSY